MNVQYEIRFIRGKWRVVAVVDRQLEIELPFEYRTYVEAAIELGRAKLKQVS